MKKIQTFIHYFYKNNNSNTNTTTEILESAEPIFKLPAIIENEIIQLILNYLLYDQDDDFIIIDKYFKKKNEIIKLSIVCKNWFNRISNLISNSIIDNLKQYKIKGYNELKVLKDSCTSSKWSLIKVDQSIITEYYEYFQPILITQSYDLKSNSNYNNIIKKQIITLYIHGDSNLKDIVLFKQLFNYRKLLSTPSVFKILNSDCFYLNKQFKLEDNNDDKEQLQKELPFIVDTIKIINIHLSFAELFEMGLFKVRNLIFGFEKKQDIENNKQVFSKICCDSNSNDQLKSIEIKGIHFDLGSIKYFNKMVNLESLSIPFYFDELYRNLSTQVEEEEESIIQSLSNNKYIKRLKLHGIPINETQSQSPKGIEIVTNGIKQIFQSNKSIKYLILNNFDVYCVGGGSGGSVNLSTSSIWSGLLLNQTLRKLKLEYYDTTIVSNLIDYLISTLFNMDTIGNKSLIKHFKLKFDSSPCLNEKVYSKTTQILQLLNKYPNSSLYSITIAFNFDDHFNLLLNLLSLSNLTINEFNLNVSYDFNINEFYKSSKKKNLKNKKIINILKKT